MRPSLLLAACAALLPAQPADPALRARAEAARSALFTKLSARLQEVMKADGPVAAIRVCKAEAPALAAEVGRHQGVRIGRTSWKLRSPGNRVPAWAVAAVADRAAEPVFQAAPGGGLRALLPIRLMKGCLACHGDAAALAPGVAEALARDYPEDRATGFKEGELRGWFWVEVPEGKAP
jgi:hypothetical protein